MDTDWRRAFHPNAGISWRDLDSVVAAIEGRGYRVGRDPLGRIVRVNATGGNDLLRSFFAPTDDPAAHLPRDLVRELDAEFGCGG